MYFINEVQDLIGILRIGNLFIVVSVYTKKQAIICKFLLHLIVAKFVSPNIYYCFCKINLSWSDGLNVLLL